MRKEVVILALALVVLLRLVSANNAPIINNLDSKILVCESSAFSLNFDVTELDGDSLTVGLSPSGPFFVKPVSSQPPITKVELFSDNLTKIFSNKIYNYTVFVTDGEFIDTKDIEIIVLEANNPPNIEYLPVTTIELNKSAELTKEIKLTDQESGNPEQGRFSFTVSDDQDLLEMKIDEKGIIHYTGSEAHLGVHEVTVCATDSGLSDVNSKIGVCTPVEMESTSCKNFLLSITQIDSPPTILAYNSTNSSGKISSTQKLTFQIFKYDPDKISPDTYWYVDNGLKEIDSGKSSDTFVYSFGCDVWGRHKVKAVISDGLLNDSTEWTFDVVKSACPEGIVPREKIGEDSCEEKWGCLDWGLCQSALQSKLSGNLVASEYESIQQKCDLRGLNESSCGYQIRTCADVDNCNTIKKKPLELMPCYFSFSPGCSDGIQNCHDGQCEFLKDCGGPCKSCPTCSDGIRNQGEEKIDCGGPCPEKCESTGTTSQPKEDPFLKQSLVMVIVVALLVALVQVFRIIHNKRKLEEQPKSGLVLRYE